MANGDGEPPRRRLADDGFLRFLLPAPKPKRDPVPTSSPPAQLAPPHRLIAPPPPAPEPRPDESLFIVPPTRPSWLPPPAPRRPPPASEPRARRGDHFGGRRNGPMARKLGDFVGNGGGRADFERRNAGRGFVKANAVIRRVAAPRDKIKKVWVAVEKKGETGSDDDQAAAGGGYAGGDEGGPESEDQPEPEDEHNGDGEHSEVSPAITVAGGDQERHHGGGAGAGTGDGPSERIGSQSDQVPCPRARIRMRRRWVECRDDIDTFASGLLSIYESLKPSEEHKSKQQQLVSSLEKSVSKEWPNAKLHLYGSCANSFGTSHSDVDVCLEIEIGVGTAAKVLLTLAEMLRADNFENVEAITSARVPIVRMSDPGSGFSCDICVNNLLAVANTKLLKDYAQIDERLLQLASIVKHWAKLRGVNETYHGTLSSYAYVIMCISFLQLREPKILPCLQVL